MAEKISVYVDEELHKLLKTEAVKQGKTLSQFMLEAALQSLSMPERESAGTKMDQIRESQENYYTTKEILEMRNEGRRY